MRSLIALATVAAASADIGIVLNVPGFGSGAAVTGVVTGTVGLTYSRYKMAILTSANNGGTWWDKSHAPYFLRCQADAGYCAQAGQDQDAAVVINADWTFSLNPPWVADPNDLQSALWRAYLVPQTYDMSFPAYMIEGIPMRGDLPNSALAWVELLRGSGQVTGGGNNAANIPAPGTDNLAPTPSPVPSPSVLPSPFMSPSPSAASVGGSSGATSMFATSVAAVALAAVGAIVAASA